MSESESNPIRDAIAEAGKCDAGFRRPLVEEGTRVVPPVLGEVLGPQDPSIGGPRMDHVAQPLVSVALRCGAPLMVDGEYRAPRDEHLRVEEQRVRCQLVEAPEHPGEVTRAMGRRKVQR